MKTLRPAPCAMRQLGRVMALLIIPVAVLAHAYLKASSPRAGEKLAVAPTRIALIFSNPVELAVTSIKLFTMDSVEIPLGSLKAHESERSGLFVDVPVALQPREYRVRWRTTSADGHPIQGSFRFTVLPPARAETTAALVEEEAHEEVNDSTAEHMLHDDDPDAVREGLGGINIPRAIVRWLSLLALFAGAGAAAFALLVLPRLRASAVVEPTAIVAIDRAVRVVGLVSAIAVAALVIPRLWAASAAVVDTGSPAIMTYATSTANGRMLLAQLITAAIAIVGFAIAARSRRPGELLAAIGMVAVIVATSYEGHAAAADSPTVIGLLTVVHVLASSIWFGMLLIVVAVAIPRMLRSSEARPLPAVAALIGIFSPIALTCGITAALVGGVLGFMHIGSFAALVRSDYGRTLIVKVAIVALVFGTGMYNWRRMKPALIDPAGADRLTRSATAELVLGALVLAATALLVALPSPASLAP